MPDKTGVIRAAVGNGRRVSWSISVMAVVSFAIAAAVWAADARYMLAMDFEPKLHEALIQHELTKLRVELAVLKSKKNLGQLSPAEKTDLEIKESYRLDLMNQLNLR